MKLPVLVTPVGLAMISAIILGACLLGQERGGTPPALGRTEIGGVFSKADASGSLEYWGVCNAEDFYPDFPRLKKISGNQDSVLESLREMFSLDPKMRVSQEPDGKIRMIEDDVPSDLLDVRIKHVRFPVEYHGPFAAVMSILKTPEVMAFRREHSIGPDAYMGGPGFAYPSEAFAPGKPSVHGDLYDATVRQALDYVLLAFHGFWSYENCKGPGDGRKVYFDFFENVPGRQLIQKQR